MKLRAVLVLALVLTACDGNGKPDKQASNAKIWEEFSGENALRHVQQLVDYGPRPPGSEAIKRSRQYITDQLKATGWIVTEQSFTDSTPHGAMTFVNLLAT